MSHRKSHSQGSIPFSWEDKPGICKTPNNECPLYKGSFPLQAINQESPSINLDKKIPLPPCLSQPPRRSTSGKGLRLQEDPFLVAYKECTKSDKSCKLRQGKNKKGVVGSNFCFRRSICIFTCRGASDVNDDSCLKLSKFPHLPAYRDRSLTLEDEQKRGFNYESWL